MSGAEAASVSIGMMRWDVWSGDMTANSSYVQAINIMSDPKWEELGYWAWFAEKDEQGKLIAMVENDTRIMEHENDVAGEAGIDYWAFLKYTDIDQNYECGLGETFQRYLETSNKHKVKFSFILDARNNDTDIFARNVSYLRDAHYFTVLDSRPLVYVYPHGIENLEAFIDTLRASSVRLGRENPYIVLYDKDGFGEDANSIYSPGVFWGAHGAPYASFIEACKERWATSTGCYVPNAAHQWDCRPYYETPPSWWAAPDDCWYQTPTGEEYTQMLQSGVDFVLNNPDKCPAMTICSKEFNGPTEGGSVWPSTTKGTTYLDAIKRVNKSAVR